MTSKLITVTALTIAGFMVFGADAVFANTANCFEVIPGLLVCR